jgi:hypothetical protein
MTIRVLTEKVNSGVRFSILTKAGNPSTRKSVGEKGRDALYAAGCLYFREVDRAFEGAGLDTHYRTVAQRWSFDYSAHGRSRGFAPVQSVALEPWGFAGGTLDAPRMNDSGSTPTDSRARTLLCYQAPLEAVPVDGNRTAFRRVFELDEAEVERVLRTPRF